jgi:hypothetical protein
MAHPDAPFKPPKRSAPLIPPRAKPLGVNRLDHQISLQNGSTSVLELSSQRIQLAKQTHSLNLFTRIEELNRELGHLRHEIQFYRQSFENLQRLRESGYDVYQQMFLALYLDQDSDCLHKLMLQLHQALEKSVQREVKAEKDWMEFWGIEYNEVELTGELI